MDGLRDVIVLVGTAISVVLGAVVAVILTRFLGRQMLAGSSQGRAKGRDARHVGVVAVCGAGVSSGLIAAGASTLVCVLGAVAGATLGVLIARVLPDWRDRTVGPWVPGTIFVVFALIAVGVALAVRFNR